MLINYNDIVVREKEIIKTGFTFLDAPLGGGITLGSSYIIAGQAGAGKSTICTQLVEKFTAMDKKVLYVSLEEHPEDQKVRTDRMNLDIYGKNFDLLKFDTGNENIEHELVPALTNGNYGLIIIDSVQELRSVTKKAESASILAAVRIIYDLCKVKKTAAIFISQLTKDGKARGSTQITHAVDAVIYLYNQAGTDIKVFQYEKNRCGLSGISAEAVLTSEGLLNPGEQATQEEEKQEENKPSLWDRFMAHSLVKPTTGTWLDKLILD